MKWNYGNPPEPRKIRKDYIVALRSAEFDLEFVDVRCYIGKGRWLDDYFEEDGDIYAWAELPKLPPLEEK